MPSYLMDSLPRGLLRKGGRASGQREYKPREWSERKWLARDIRPIPREAGSGWPSLGLRYLGGPALEREICLRSLTELLIGHRA